MIPAAEPLVCSFSGVLPNGVSEFRATNQGQDLRKATRNGYHKIPPACGWHGAGTPWPGVDEQLILLISRGHFKNLIWTRVDRSYNCVWQ